MGIIGQFYTNCTLQVPAKTRLSDRNGIRFSLSNGRDSCFTTFHSPEEVAAFAAWITAAIQHPDFREAWAQLLTTEVRLIEKPPVET